MTQEIVTWCSNECYFTTFITLDVRRRTNQN